MVVGSDQTNLDSQQLSIPSLTVTHTQNGTQALFSVLERGHTFGMIILDRNLGHESPNGDSICSRMRAFGYDGIIVGVTGDALDAQRKSFLSSGLTAVALKGDNNEDEHLLKICEALASRRSSKGRNDNAGRMVRMNTKVEKAVNNKVEVEGKGDEKGKEKGEEDEGKVTDKDRGSKVEADPYRHVFTALGTDKGSIRSTKEIIASTVDEHIEKFKKVKRDFAGDEPSSEAWKTVHSVAGGYKLLNVDFASTMAALEAAMRDDTGAIPNAQIQKDIDRCLNWLVGLRVAVKESV